MELAIGSFGGPLKSMVPMPKSILYKDYIIRVSAEFDDDTKFWVGRAEIRHQRERRILKATIGPEGWHTTALDAENFMTSAGKAWIDKQ